MVLRFTPSTQQINIKNWLYENRGEGNNLVVQAVAGSGKSTTLAWLAQKQQDFKIVSFSRFSVADLRSKLPEESQKQVVTYNSLGYSGIRKAFPKVKLDEDKLDKHIKPYLTSNETYLAYPIKQLVNAIKNLAIRDWNNDKTLLDIATEYDFNLYDEKSYASRERIFQLVPKIMESTLNDTDTVDFTDQLAMPYFLNLPLPQYGIVMADEFQDTNIVQRHLIEKSLGRNSVLIGVGDKHQSIFGWRQANRHAMDDMVDVFNAETLPLSISYRCPQAIMGYVNEKFPYIQFSVPKTNREGSIQDVSLDDALQNVTQNDMVICRVNAELVSAAFALIRLGKPAYIQGRDIGKRLITVIKQMKAPDVPSLLLKLNKYQERMTERYTAIGKLNKINALNDEVSTIKIFCEMADTTDGVMDIINRLYADESVGRITLSTVHRAKGLQANDVYILRPDLIPHPKARGEEQKVEEQNVHYVAVTRTKNNLYFVH